VRDARKQGVKKRDSRGGGKQEKYDVGKTYSVAQSFAIEKAERGGSQQK